jgi:hypothetical protein
MPRIRPQTTRSRSKGERLLGLLGLLTVTALAACKPLPTAEGPADPTHAKQPSDAALQQPATPPQQAAQPAPEAKVGPRLMVEGEQGQPLTSAQSAMETARSQLAECTPNSGGILHVRIRTGPTRTSMEVDPKSSVSGATSQCVLQALSTIDVDEALNQGSPSDRPQRGGVSVVRLEW